MERFRLLYSFKTLSDYSRACWSLLIWKTRHNDVHCMKLFIYKILSWFFKKCMLVILVVLFACNPIVQHGRGIIACEMWGSKRILTDAHLQSQLSCLLRLYVVLNAKSIIEVKCPILRPDSHTYPRRTVRVNCRGYFIIDNTTYWCDGLHFKNSFKINGKLVNILMWSVFRYVYETDTTLSEQLQSFLGLGAPCLSNKTVRKRLNYKKI